MSGRLSVVVGGQFGSEAKGRIAAYLCRPEEDPDRPVYCVRVGGSNAGHTVYGDCPPSCTATDHDVTDSTRHPWRLRHVPVAAVSNPNATLVLAAGSEISPEVLVREVEELQSAGYQVADRLYVDPTATVVEPHHQQAESSESFGVFPGLVERIGSTGKGIGAARADRAMRRAQLWGDYPDKPNPQVEYLADTAVMLQRAMVQNDAHVVIEGTQGYGLGQHAGHYPQVTSSDCRAIDFLSMAGLSPWDEAVQDFDVYVVYRTRPIRVAGNSGPLKGETTWEELGLQPELTTVTRNIRRVGEWDGDLARRSLQANGGPGSCVKVCVTMLDQFDPESAGATDTADLGRVGSDWLIDREDQLGCKITLIGTGPHTLIDRR